MKRIQVAFFNDRATAKPIRLRLVQAGILAETDDPPGLARPWFVAKTSASKHIKVSTVAVKPAQDRSLAWNQADGVLGTAIRCPQCQSSWVDYPQVARKSFSVNLAIGLRAGIGLVEKDYDCEHCRNMWPKPSPAICFRLSKLWRNKLTMTVSLMGLLLGAGSIFAESVNPVRSPNNEAKMELNNSIITGTPNAAQTEAPTYIRDVLPIMVGKCARCHGNETKVLPNWLDFKTTFVNRIEIKRRVWDSWTGAYYKQTMPAGNCLEAQTMTPVERTIIRDWVRQGALLGASGSDNGLQPKAERIELGKRLCNTICVVCHQSNGLGIPARFPPLAQSDFLNADKRRAIKVVVDGLQGEVVVNGQKFNNNMPKVPLSDQEVANVLTFIYSSFGNSGKEVTFAEVAAVRMEQTLAIPAEQKPRVTVQEKSPFE